MNSDRIFFSSKNIYHDLPELSPMQVRRLNQPSLQSPLQSRTVLSLVRHMSGAAFGTGLNRAVKPVLVGIFTVELKNLCWK